MNDRKNDHHLVTKNLLSTQSRRVILASKYQSGVPGEQGTENVKVVVIGGSGGIGSAVLKRLRDSFPQASLSATWCRTRPVDESLASWSQVDVLSEQSIADFAAGIDSVDWLINATGMLHADQRMPEKTLQQVDGEFFLHNLQINALSTLLIAKHFSRALKNAKADEVTPQFATVSARVGSIEDNRLGGWYSYRCSKAALNMAIKNISIEWQRTLPAVCVTALHPGTTDTSLSEPFQRNVPEGKLFTPEKVADDFIRLLTDLTAKDTGGFLAYDGERLPW